MANETESLKTRIKAARDKYQRKGYAETAQLLTDVLEYIRAKDRQSINQSAKSENHVV